MKFTTFLVAICAFQVAIAQDLTVERIWKNYEFVSKRIDGFNSLPDGESFTKIFEEDGQQSLQKFTFKKLNGKGTELINLSAITYNGKQVDIEEISLSKSGNIAIIMNNMTPIYRRSYSAQIYLYDLKTKKSDSHSGEITSNFTYSFS